ncbi:MAG: PilZ domain-containing protein [Deltaproteobacteria bacterium]|nr:PilZ domain-containing protein [Deltaproteobacteria bacterium]
MDEQAREELEALRKEVRLQVNHEFASMEAFITEYVADLSRSGVFVRSDDPLPVGTRVALKFSVVADEIETLEGIGEVVRVVLPGGDRPAGMGVVFRELSDYSQDLIERLVTGG